MRMDMDTHSEAVPIGVVLGGIGLVGFGSVLLEKLILMHDELKLHPLFY